MDANDSTSSDDDLRDESPEPQQALEPLACVACRARKLKCDRTKPACSRCTKATDGTVCVYPESRRKPMFKRRNVKDIEARLAQVEGLLKDAPGLDRKRTAADEHDFESASGSAVRNGTGLFSVITETELDRGPNDGGPGPGVPVGEGAFSTELMDLGMSEAPPPYEIIEVLHTAYFQNQHMFIPIVHKARYLKAFHSAPHLRPPMGLQYAIWAMSSQVYRKYSGFHDAFYRRARQYLENDEMKGHGEHFITIGHAQAWALLAAYEARRLFFTRAAMSCSRCVRLVGMMGLNRLDDETSGDRIASTLQPPADWTELEERRRVYWGAFCVDSHASISTGWPTLINANDATTHLPSSEEAFAQGIPQVSCTIDNIFSGSTYSTFSTAILVCHLFNSILLHVQLKPSDRPEDFEYGPFWERHRSLDTKLSSAFVFLPERYRLPSNFHDPVAVHTNLNLHAAVICLHNAAVERAEAHNMPEAVVQSCYDRMSTAAREIVNIIERTSHMAGSYKSPLASLSLYCATSVFVYQAMMHEKNQTQDTDAAETTAGYIAFIMRCMDNGRANKVTRLLLHQAIMDIDRNGLATAKHFSWFARYSSRTVDEGHYVPVLARSAVSRHSWQQPPMAGRLPLINTHNTKIMKSQQCCPIGSTNLCDSCRKMEAAQASRHASTTMTTTTTTTTNTNGGDLTKKRRRLQSPEAAEMPSIDAFRSHYGGAFVVLPRRAANVSPTPSDDSSDEDVGSSVHAGPPSSSTGHSSGSSGRSCSRPSASTQGSLSRLGTSSLPGTVPPGVGSVPDSMSLPKPQQLAPAVDDFFPTVSLPDLWAGTSPSVVANASLGDTAAFMGLSSASSDGQHAQPGGGVTLSMEPPHDFSSMNETVTAGLDEATIQVLLSGDTRTGGQLEGPDPWTTFLQAGDFDNTDWSTIDNQS
ncbi:hypothetical protein HMPREF1624_03120 [Sporothrix schenckii ATCC 58251]|uniref:Zn(2)-C6 fungal-type domain-containing protein n=1 Tax=Sporothrix schenckii (strain ATCC 58251 / de Perez 2211183) TaxID=1391915 RepID=U7PXS3_SPOS1|nr:hypothetical protein HMPREF1624_03120 [Sporothrix schenckii ATCC 58251]